MQTYCPIMSRQGNLVKCFGVRCEWFDEEEEACAIRCLAMHIKRLKR